MKKLVFILLLFVVGFGGFSQYTFQKTTDLQYRLIDPVPVANKLNLSLQYVPKCSFYKENYPPLQTHFTYQNYPKLYREGGLDNIYALGQRNKDLDGLFGLPIEILLYMLSQ